LDPPGGGDGWGYRRLGIGYIVDALTLAGSGTAHRSRP
jgi:hypothetical protein